MLRRLCIGTMLLLTSRFALGQDLPLSGVLIEGRDWELVSAGHGSTDGPAVDATGQVYFSDLAESKIYKIDLDGKVSLFVENTQKACGLMFGAEGKLYACQPGARQIVAFDSQGQAETIAEDVDSNDLVVASHRGIYASDPRGRCVWYINPQREKRRVALDIKPNGVILTPDQGTFVVSDGAEPTLWTFRVEADGSLKYRTAYYGPLRMVVGASETGSEGMTVDSVGRLYVATSAGLQMFDPTGRMGGVIAKPVYDRYLSNVCFGGAKLNYLYVTAGKQVFRRETQATGIRYGVK